MLNIIKSFKEVRFLEIVIRALFVALVTIIVAYTFNIGGVLGIGLSISLALIFLAFSFQNKKVVKIMPIIIAFLGYISFLNFSNSKYLEIGIAVIIFYIIAAEYYEEK